MLYVHVVCTCCMYMSYVHVVCTCRTYMSYVHAHTGPHSSSRAVHDGAGHSPVHRVCQYAHEYHQEENTCREAERGEDILPCECISQYYIYIPQCLGLVAFKTEMYVLCFTWGIKVRPVLNFYFRRTIIILLLLTS